MNSAPSAIPFVPFEITVCGIDELPAHRDRRVTHVLTLLDPGWPTPDALTALGAVERLDMRFHDVVDPGSDWTPPEIEHVERLLAFGRTLPAENGHLLIHCQMGISRSSAAMLLILAQARPDRPAAAALAELVRIRDLAWPNLRMVEMGDVLLGRGGALVAAARARYGAMLKRRPKLREAMIRLGRARELDSAILGE
ncbi:MAG TPA: protein-tyrosine-phosphatase [Stellaceae bacterium]|nr:protein-tyrosine-phosphatase [Stellaceae bacterium]